MSYTYTVELSKSEKIIKYQVIGTIEKSDIGVGWREVFNMLEFSEMGYDILADYSHADFKFTIADTKVLDSILNASSSKVPGKKIAVIVKMPYSTAISMIVKEKFHADLNYNAMIFSTQEAALMWLNE